MKRNLSLKHVILGTFLGILVPLSLFLIIYSTYVAGSVKNTVYESERSALIMMKSNFENTMSSAQRFMSNLITGDMSFQMLSNEMGENDVYLRSYEVQQEMKNILASNPELFGMAIYAPANDWYAEEHNILYEVTAEERIEIGDILEKEVRGNAALWDREEDTWFCRTIGGRHYLCREMSYHNVMCIAFIDLERISGRVKQEYQMDGALIFLDGDREFYMDPGLAPENLELPGEDERYRISGRSRKYMVLEENIQNLNLVWATPYEGLLSNLDRFQAGMFICAVLVLLAVPFACIYLRKMVLRPLSSLLDTMQSIRKGNLDAQAEQTYATAEFRQVNETFNHMMGEIRSLKIEAYEKELERKQAAFQFLQVQIRPHFYLNCLKNLYGMAQSGRFGEIQKTILLLSSHLRYTFSTMEDTVSLDMEIVQCRNYVDLFAINHQEKAQLSTNCDVQLTGLPIPPVSILTFVENSVKYGFMPGKQLEIRISARNIRTEESDLVHITVADNGPGFPEEAVKQLNSGQKVLKDGQGAHIGIYNVLERFRILYGDSFVFMCSNRNGAIMELFFPADGGKGAEDYESVDCG